MSTLHWKEGQHTVHQVSVWIWCSNAHAGRLFQLITLGKSDVDPAVRLRLSHFLHLSQDNSSSDDHGSSDTPFIVTM